MGAWGTTVLENDGALDAMIRLEKLKNPKQAVVEYLDSEYIEEKLLAVEIIDISLNGVDKCILGSFYGYEKWFENLTKYPMEELRGDAFKTLKYIKEHDYEWFPAFVEERIELFDKIEKRLKLCVKENGGIEK